MSRFIGKLRGEKCHYLRECLSQREGKRLHFVPRNVARAVPLPADGLIVKLSDFGRRGMVALVERERISGTTGFNARAAWCKTCVRVGSQWQRGNVKNIRRS